MRGIEQYLQVDAATLGALKYAGTWNASTNTPTLASGVGTQGQYYVVSVAGSTNLDGETNWQVGDWAVFNGSVWQKVDGGSTGLLSTLTVTGNTFLATTSGNVGIGTSSPSYKLDVAASAARIRSTSAYSGLLLSSGDPNASTRNWLVASNWNAYGDFVLVQSNAQGGDPISAGTTRLTVDASGNVGIGATSVTAIYGRTLQIGSGTSEATTSLVGSTGSVFLATVGATGQLIARGGMALVLGSNDVERMRITSAGDVGIGTSSPARKLDVLGLGGIAARLTTPDSNGVLEYYSQTATRFNWIIGPQYNVNGGFEITPSTAAGGTTYSSPAVVVTSGGNVGIGTSSPSYKLDVAGSTSTARLGKLTLTNDTPFVTGANIDSGANSLALGASGAGIVALFTNNTERMRITSAGDVGIGTTSPGSLLHLNSAAGGGDVPRLRFTNAGTGTGATDGMFVGISNTSQLDVWNFEASDIRFATNSTERMRLDASGNLGLGVTPSAWGNGVSLQGSGWALSTTLGTDCGAYYVNARQNGYGSINANCLYRTSASAGAYGIESSTHKWFTAPSGTAGNAISFTQAMTLDASGNLLVGATSGAARIISAVPDGTYSFGAVGTTKAIRISHSSTASKIEGVDSTLSASYQPLTLNGSYLAFETSVTERLRITSAGNIHTPAGATTMTNGFFYIPAAAGVPTGVPTAITGTVPMYYDTTNNKFYVYNGAWKSVTLT